MVYHGVIKNGEVVIQPRPSLPEGARVRVEVETAPTGESPAKADNGQQLEAFWETMRELAGQAKTLPPDIAEHHDHYLYGRPKK